MMIDMDFSSSKPPTAGEFFSKLTVMIVVWVCILFAVERISKAFATIFWSHSIPIDRASIPSKLPHPNPSGGAIPFDVPLLKATDEQIQAFITFRGILSGDQNNIQDEKTLQRVAKSAAEYKGLLYQVRAMKWIDDHFRLHKSNLKYPYVGRHWNGWSSFYVETGTDIRKLFLACMTIIFEHAINGFLLPGLYLLTRNVSYYNMALYGEVAYMVYASSLIAASYALGRDVSIEQMHKAVWPLLLTHHIASMGLCTACIFVGESVPKDLVCSVLLALVGLTSSIHYVGQILDFSPLAQSNAPYTRLCNHIFCLASQIIFRGIYWIQILYIAIVHCLETHGLGSWHTIGCALALLLFSLFNIDFIKYHVKATNACWMKIQQEKVVGKDC